MKQRKKDVLKLRFNPSKDERCRLSLKDAYKADMRLEFVGYLSGIGPVEKNGLSRRKASMVRHRGLIVDIHQVDNGHFDEIKLNHTHFSTHNLNLIKSEGQFIRFKARVNKYQATYLGSVETRYGLSEIQLMKDEPLFWEGLDAKYHDKLTVHQKESLLAIRHFIIDNPNILQQRFRANPLDKQIAGILAMDGMQTFQERTRELNGLADLLVSRTGWKRLDEFQENIVNAEGEVNSNLTNDKDRIRDLQQQLENEKKMVALMKLYNNRVYQVNGHFKVKMAELQNTNSQLRSSIKTLKKVKPFSAILLSIKNSLFKTKKQELKLDKADEKKLKEAENAEVKLEDLKALQERFNN